MSQHTYIAHLVTTPTDHLIFEISCSRGEYGYFCYFFPVVDVHTHSVAALFSKYLMANSIYVCVQTVWVFVIIRTVSLLSVFFRVI